MHLGQNEEALWYIKFAVKVLENFPEDYYHVWYILFAFLRITIFLNLEKCLMKIGKYEEAFVQLPNTLAAAKFFR